jgi:hypothetical protein
MVLIAPKRTFFSRRQSLRAGLGAVVGLALPGTAFAQSTRYGIQGKMAPALQVGEWIDAGRNPSSFSLAAAKGRWVLLKCFQSWCPGCHSHGFPTMKKVLDALGDDDRLAIADIQTVFEGFGTNTRDQVREIQLRYKLTVPIGHDAGNPDGDHHPHIMRAYRTGGTPWIIIIDPTGRVAYNHYSLDADKFISFIRQQPPIG